MVNIQHQKIEPSIDTTRQKSRKNENLPNQEQNIDTTVSSDSVSTYENSKINEEWNNYLEEQLEHFTCLTRNYTSIASSYFESWFKLYGSFYESNKTFQDLFFSSLFANLGISNKTD